MGETICFHIDDDTAVALDRMLSALNVDMQVDIPREAIAAAALRQWLVGLGYMRLGNAVPQILEQQQPTVDPAISGAHIKAFSLILRQSYRSDP